MITTAIQILLKHTEKKKKKMINKFLNQLKV